MIDFTVSGGDASVSGGDASAVMDYDLVYSAVYNAAIDALSLEQDVTEGQSISSTALTYFEGVLANRLLPVDYVIYVGSPYYYTSGNTQRLAYEYCMAYGDLDAVGTHFTGTATICTMRLSGTPSVTYYYDQEISLYAPMYYARSNLGDYSGVIAYDWTGFLVLVFLMLGGLVWFIGKLLRVKY